MKDKHTPEEMIEKISSETKVDKLMKENKEESNKVADSSTPSYGEVTSNQTDLGLPFIEELEAKACQDRIPSGYHIIMIPSTSKKDLYDAEKEYLAGGLFKIGKCTLKLDIKDVCITDGYMYFHLSVTPKTLKTPQWSNMESFIESYMFASSLEFTDKEDKDELEKEDELWVMPSIIIRDENNGAKLHEYVRNMLEK